MVFLIFFLCLVYFGALMYFWLIAGLIKWTLILIGVTIVCVVVKNIAIHIYMEIKWRKTLREETKRYLRLLGRIK